ncbi:hypothetical protein QBL07_000165 (plasmid) [Gordonia rubripertincta]|uniref:Uncharacterized protein n=1 Tax=Gordonia rubripertincta TaxID=36822 RepID=A0AAW6RF43_GORRU|nr:hypothetical protein [Gordonia rubripertincta]MCZ4537940.1 hypothetical protein [Gordonia terrae]MDG6782975.1 hypothetical protein [Gordonia rubripertincta]
MVFNASEARVFVEHELTPLSISRPSVLFKLPAIGVAVTLYPDDGVVPTVFLEAEDGETELLVRPYVETAELVAAVGGTLTDDDDVSFTVADCDLAVALALLVAPEEAQRASEMIGPLNRYMEACDVIRAYE